MTEVRALVGVLAVLLLVGCAAGCGLVSDQTKQEAKKKVEAKGQQVKQEVNKGAPGRPGGPEEEVRRSEEGG